MPELVSSFEQASTPTNSSSMTTPSTQRAAPTALFSRADRYLLFVTLIWGSTFSITKFALHEISPYLYQGIRFALASIMVGIYTWSDVRATTLKTFRHGAVLGFLLGLGFILQTVGLANTTASKAGFLTGTLVVFTPLLQLVIERRLPSWEQLVGVVITAIGLLIFTGPTGEHFGTGDILVLACAVVFAVYVVLLDVYTKEAFHRDIVFHQFVVTSVMGFVLVPWMGPVSLSLSVEVFGALLYLSFFASTLALFIQSKYQRETTPTKAALIYTLEPIFAAILAVFWLGEHMSTTAILGASIMVAGLVTSELLSIAGKRRRVKS